MNKRAHYILDHVTDIAAIAAITYLSVTGTPPAHVVGAIASVALGQRAAKSELLRRYLP